MADEYYSPLTANDIAATLKAALTQRPQPSDFAFFPKRPTEPLRGEVNVTGFRITLSEIYNPRASPQVIGRVVPLENSPNGYRSLLTVEYKSQLGSPYKCVIAAIVLVVSCLWAGLPLKGEVGFILAFFSVLVIAFMRAVYVSRKEASRKLLILLLKLQKNSLYTH